MTESDVRIGVLGSTTVALHGEAADVGSSKQRALLAVLALGEGRPVSTERIVDALWQDAPPPGVTTTLHGYVASLRRLLEPSRAPRTNPTILVTAPGGYALRLASGCLDAEAFATAVERSATALRGIPDHNRPTADGVRPAALRTAYAELEAAVSSWRGEPFADLGDLETVEAERQRLRELLLTARIQQTIIQLALGENTAAATRLKSLTAQHPLREQLWILRAVALTRDGRQADALETLQDLRDVLVDQLGIDPSPTAQQLQQDILKQDGSLLLDAPPSVARRTAAPPRFGWPLVGRTAELESLSSGLDRAESGWLQLVQVVGEAGIGKSRLVKELAVRAVDRGFVLVEGRCSSDDGAPPLWSWRQVLRSLASLCDVEIPELSSTPIEPGAEGAAAQFALSDAVIEALRSSARVAPVMVVIEDLHWADASTLRVLRHLADHRPDERILLATTQRPDDGSGLTVELGYAFARADAMRVELEGLNGTESADLVAAVSGTRPDPSDEARLRERTGGNPFFLSEVARSGDPLGGATPQSLSELVAHRIKTLPEATREALEAAAANDHVIDIPLVAAVIGIDEAELSVRLAPARTAGLLLAEPDERVTFVHAIVRDAIVESARKVAIEQWHARLARALEARQALGTPEHSAIAHHWREAGYAYAGLAWRSAVAAAEAAREVHATGEAAQLLAQALESQRLDIGSTDAERYTLLMHRASACRVAADWAGAAAAVTQAITTAERMGEPELAARASVGSVEGAVWHARTYGTVQDDLVAALTRAMENLPPGDSELRCRVMLSLAVEAYYLAPVEETDVLVDEALAIAERLGDPRLLVVALQLGFSARWRPATAEWRLATIRRAYELSLGLDDVHLEVTSRSFLAIGLVELGHVAEGMAMIEPTIEIASEHGILTAVTILELLRGPIFLLQGKDDRAEQSVQRVLELAERVTVPNMNHASAALLSVQVLWQERFDELSATLTQLLLQQTVPVDSFIVTLLLRVGDVEQARQVFEATYVEPTDHDYMGVIQWCLSGELALGLGLADVGARAYDWMAQYAGRICSAGSTTILGPVDAFLALAAAATGETATATRHADDALALCEEWEFVRVAEWLTGLRRTHGF